MLIVAILNFTFRNISRLFSIGLLALSTGANNNTTTDAAEYCKIPFDSHKHIDKYKTKEYVATERNSTYRKLNRQRSVFPSDKALLKALYLATFEATKKWTQTIRNWGSVYGELCIMYEGRLPE